jgi:hypothetical protein
MARLIRLLQLLAQEHQFQLYLILQLSLFAIAAFFLRI